MHQTNPTASGYFVVVDSFLTIFPSCFPNSNGYNGQTGSFKLRISPIVTGDLIEDAMDLGLVSDASLVVGGTTEGGKFYPNLPSCYNDIVAPAAVYKLQAKNSSITASVTGFSFDAQISVYKDDSTGGLTCHGQHAWGNVLFTASLEDDTIFYIVIHGCCEPTVAGNYVLRVGASPFRNLCDDMVDLGTVPEGGLLYSDSTFGGSLNANVSSCPYGTYYSNGDSLAKVYMVEGTGSQLSASVFVPTYGSDMSVGVFTGACEALACIEDADSESSRSVSFYGEAGKYFFIMIQGCCGANSEGEFVLTVKDPDSQAFESPNASSSKKTEDPVGSNQAPATGPPATEPPTTEPDESDAAADAETSKATSVGYHHGSTFACIAFLMILWG
jgi:hypothetical protein